MPTLSPDHATLEAPGFDEADHDGWHRAQAEDEHWELDHPHVWRNALEEYRHQVSHRYGVPPLEAPEHQRLLGALVRLVRVAIRNGSKRDLTAIWYAFTHTVTNESGSDEIDAHGLLRLDTVSSYLEWQWHLKFVSEDHPGRAPPAAVRTHVATSYLLHLYESTGVGAMTFIEAMATMAAGERHNIWDAFWPPRKQARKIQTPYFSEAVLSAGKALAGLSPRKGLFKADLKALQEYVEGFNYKSFTTNARSDLRYIRDALDHGRFFVTEDELILDSIEHQIVNLYGLDAQPGRRGNRTHPYKYRTLQPDNVKAMFEHALGLSALAWMGVSEFFFVGRRQLRLRASTRPEPDMIAAARAMLAELRVSTTEKRESREAKRKELRDLQGRVRVTGRTISRD